MLASLRSIAARVPARAFSTSSPARADLAKLTLIGRLGKEPEVRTAKNDHTFVTYSVATKNYPPPPPNADGTRNEAKPSWHKITSFSDHANKYLVTLKKGSLVYVEASFEVREPENGEGQRQILLRHEHIRVLRHAVDRSDNQSESE